MAMGQRAEREGTAVRATTRGQWWGLRALGMGRCVGGVTNRCSGVRGGSGATFLEGCGTGGSQIPNF